MNQAEQENLRAILQSPSYRLAERDTEFLQRSELRPVRMQLELLKPEMALAEQKVASTIVVFGGTQIIEPSAAQARLEHAEAEFATSPDNGALKRKVERARRIAAKAQVLRRRPRIWPAGFLHLSDRRRV